MAMDDPGPGPLPGKGKGKEKKLEWLVLQGNWTRLASHGTVTKVPYLVLLDSTSLWPKVTLAGLLATCRASA
jgi:hypothetical protein